MKIALPARRNVQATTEADPLKFYYWPIAGSFYRARFADALRLLGGPKGRLLDVGCGCGIFLVELARHCDQLVACDYHTNLATVAEMLEAESVSAPLAQTDARHLPFADMSVDAIVCMSVLEHLEDLSSPADEFFRILRPGGVAIVGVPISNLMTETMLRISYLTLDAQLEDEHVSTHRDVLAAFGRRFHTERRYHIPRLAPEMFRMYSTVRFRKPLHSEAL